MGQAAIASRLGEHLRSRKTPDGSELMFRHTLGSQHCHHPGVVFGEPLKAVLCVSGPTAASGTRAGNLVMTQAGMEGVVTHDRGQLSYMPGDLEEVLHDRDGLRQMTNRLGFRRWGKGRVGTGWLGGKIAWCELAIQQM